jgi:hypothetical protein
MILRFLKSLLCNHRDAETLILTLRADGARVIALKCLNCGKVSQAREINW